jgi:hypothetical protein
MARVGRSVGTRLGGGGGDGGDDADRISRTAVRALAWATGGGIALAGALAIVALGGGDPQGPWSLAVTVLAVISTSLMAVGLYITVQAADAAEGTDPDSP